MSGTSTKTTLVGWRIDNEVLAVMKRRVAKIPGVTLNGYVNKLLKTQVLRKH